MIIRSDKRVLNGKFLSYFIRFNKNKIMRLVSGTTVYHIYGSDVKTFQILLPSNEEQNKIVSTLLNSNEEIKILKKKLKKLHESKKGLMQQLLTGKRRVKVL